MTDQCWCRHHRTTSHVELGFPTFAKKTAKNTRDAHTPNAQLFHYQHKHNLAMAHTFCILTYENVIKRVCMLILLGVQGENRISSVWHGSSLHEELSAETTGSTAAWGVLSAPQQQ